MATNYSAACEAEKDMLIGRIAGVLRYATSETANEKVAAIADAMADYFGKRARLAETLGETGEPFSGTFKVFSDEHRDTEAVFRRIAAEETR